MLAKLILVMAAACGLAACGASREAAEPQAPRAAAPGVRLVLLGRFDEPTYLTAPPGDRAAASWSSARAASGSCATGASCGGRS